MDWQFNYITNDSISSSVKKPERDQSNAKSLELMTKVLSMKQCVELESTRVTMVTEGIRLEVSFMVKEFGLETVDALRCSSTVALIRSMQPWSCAGAKGLLPIFLALWQGF